MTEKFRHRLWLAICCFGFAVLSFTNRPGNIISDTKLDLALNPIGFLERASHLWDLQHFGQLQNQVAGYLFPMGPFFALGKLVNLEPWVTQRLWITLLLCVAFLGVERLARQFGIGSPATRVIGALVYALAPRTLSIIGEISVEWLPAAMLPWILIPLLTAAETGQRARAAVRSGLAVALCGGVNAVAVLAVLVAPVLYILTRPRPVPRWRMLGWWSGAIMIATLFWWLPLLLVGRYAFSFLPFTETSSTTTQVTSLTNVLRGATDWVRYQLLDGVLVQPVGVTIATSAVMMVVTGLLAALGLVGLARRDLPARGFVMIVFLVGITALVAGHMSVLEPIVAEPVRWLLDGPLAPLRNLRKFDPLVRLPLALGLAHLLCHVRLRVVKGVALVTLAALVLPAFNQGVAAPGDFKEVPPYWHEAAAWLDANAGNDGVLVVPGAKFGEYLWGRPMDEPMQSMFATRWASRQLVAAGSVGMDRLLDAIDQRLTAGHGSRGLTEVFRRMGVHYLLVRNDLKRSSLGGAWPTRIYEALRESPGITHVRSFGGEVGDTATDDVVDSVDWPFPALEIYKVAGSTDVVNIQSSGSALRVRGGPDSLLAMGDLGVLDGEPVLVNDDGAKQEVPTVVSDGLRLRERHFGEIRSNWTPTLPSDSREEFTGVKALDLLESAWLQDTATVRFDGIAGITASSSGSDAGAIPGLSSAGRSPWAAMDGDLDTGWESDGWNPPEGEWLRVVFPRERSLTRFKVTFSQQSLLGPAPSRVVVETQAGQLVQDVRSTSSAQWLRAPSGSTTWVRIKILTTADDQWTFGERVGITEISIPGVLPSRTVVLPDKGGDLYTMDRGVDARPVCMRNQSRWICNPMLAKQGEEGAGFDRSFTADVSASTRLSGTAVLRDAKLVDQFSTLSDDLTELTASSQMGKEAVNAARAAFDADSSTTWVADFTDPEPTLTVDWKRKRRISQIQIARPGGDKQVLDVIVTGDKGQARGGRVDSDGYLRFKPLDTTSLKLRLYPASRRLQITELVIPGIPPASRPEGIPFQMACGQGPQIQLNGTPVATKVSGTYADLLEKRPLQFTACDKVKVLEGGNRVRVPGWDPFAVENLLIGSVRREESAKEAEVVSGAWTSTVREARVWAPEDSFLFVNENFNEGWRASVGDMQLQPVRLDGWKQGWQIPAGTSGTVRMIYAPDQAYRWALGLGLGGIGLLVLLSVVLRGPRPEHVFETAPAAESRLTNWRMPYAVGLALLLGGWVASWPGMLAVLAPTVMMIWARARGIRRIDTPWTVAWIFCAAILSLAVSQMLYDFGLANDVVELLSDQVTQLIACAAVGVLFGRLVMEQEPQGEAPELAEAESALSGAR